MPLFSSILLYLNISFLLLMTIATHSSSNISSPTIPNAAVNTRFRKCSAYSANGPTQPGLWLATNGDGQMLSTINRGEVELR